MTRGAAGAFTTFNSREVVMAQDLVHGWAPVYPHLKYADPAAAIAWLARAFGFRERVRMAQGDGTIITSKLETPGGGLVMVAGSSDEFKEWIRARVPNFREPKEPGWPNLTHTTTVMVSEVDAHHARAQAAGAHILMPPKDHPWGLRTYAALDLEGHRWEFAQELGTVEPEDWGATRMA